MSHVADWLRGLLGMRPIEEVIDAHTTIAAAKPGHVTVRGHISATSTIGGEFVPEGAVFCRIVLGRLHTETRSNRNSDAPANYLLRDVVPLATHTHAIECTLDDGSGALGTIDFTGAAILSERHIDRASRVDAIDPRVVSYARAHGFPDLDSLVVTASSFVAGDVVSVFGTATLFPEIPHDDPYRTVASSRVRIAAIYVAHDPLEELARSGRLNAAD